MISSRQVTIFGLLPRGPSYILQKIIENIRYLDSHKIISKNIICYYFRLRYKGSQCVFSCLHGYQLHGPASVTCLDTFSWSTIDMPDCKPRIPVPTWIIVQGLKFRPGWAEIFDSSDPSQVFLDVDKLKCEKIDEELFKFMKFLESFEFKFDMLDLEIFYTACNGPAKS